MRSCLCGGCKECGQSDPREQDSQDLVEVNRISEQGRPYSGQHHYRPHPHFNQYPPSRGREYPPEMPEYTYHRFATRFHGPYVHIYATHALETWQQKYYTHTHTHIYKHTHTYKHTHIQTHTHLHTIHTHKAQLYRDFSSCAVYGMVNDFVLIFFFHFSNFLFLINYLLSSCPGVNKERFQTWDII